MAAKQFKSFKEVLDYIKSSPKEPVVGKKLSAQLCLCVQDLIAAKYRKAAMEILIKTEDQNIIGEFLYYYYSEKGNVACMVINKARKILVKKRKIKNKENNWNKQQ